MVILRVVSIKMWPASVLLFFVIIFECVSNPVLGACTTPAGAPGLCVLIKSCPDLLKLALADENSASELQLLEGSRCDAYEKGWRVCCGSGTDVSNNLLPDRTQCGIQDEFRVLGGVDAALGEFPWMALLEQTVHKTGNKVWGCGGTLISKRYVLTAAHCFLFANVRKVRLGEWNLDKERDCIPSISGELCSSPPQDIAVDTITKHEEFTILNEKYSFFHAGAIRYGVGRAVNDIALIRLATLATINDFVKPICLPLPTERSNPGELLYVAGWGATLDKKYSAIKQKLEVPIVGFEACKTNFTISEKELCAGGVENKDSCKGDSGGPLMRSIRGELSQFYIEGIVSYGRVCGLNGYPGIYTRVTTFLDWIKKNVKP